MRLASWAFCATAVVHGGFAAAVATLPAKRVVEPTVITVREAPKRAPKPPPPPPPPPPATAATTPAPKPAEPAKPKPPKRATPPPTPTPAPAPTSTAAAPTDFGLRLGNASGNGPAVAAAPTPTAPQDAPPPTRKTLETKPADAGGCSDPIVKPRPLNVVQPAFTQEARDAGITGKVRVEITISATGTVTAARVIAGLGHGLDEAALEAARASTFSPATRCGTPVETTFTIGMRFQ